MVNINIEKFGKNQFKISILHDGKLEYFNDNVDKEQLVTSILLEAIHRVLKRMEDISDYQKIHSDLELYWMKHWGEKSRRCNCCKKRDVPLDELYCNEHKNGLLFDAGDCIVRKCTDIVCNICRHEKKEEKQ